jgi:hypothetical protein
MNKFARFLPVVAAVALIGGATIEKRGSFDITEKSLKTTRFPVVALEKKGSFDITNASGTSKGGDTPVVTGKIDAQTNAGGTSKGEEVPVTPGLNVGGTGKGGDVPVTPGFAGRTAAAARVGGGGSGSGTGDVIVIG